MMMDIDRDDWAARLAKPLRDLYGAVANEPIPDRLREFVEQLGRKRSTGAGTALDPTRAASQNDHPS
jgi:hypothetical protein